MMKISAVFLQRTMLPGAAGTAAAVISMSPRSRKNYDIEALGLTAEAVQALYTGKVNTEVVSQLLGNPKFATLTNLLAQYQKEVFITGMSAMNQNLDFLRSLMLSRAKICPKDKAAANAAAADLQSLKLPPVSVDTAAIQNLFTYRNCHWQFPSDAWQIRSFVSSAQMPNPIWKKASSQQKKLWESFAEN